MATLIQRAIGAAKLNVATFEEVETDWRFLVPEAGELLPLLTYAVTRRLKCDEFKDLVFAHPTLGENLWEAMGEIGGFSIHI